MCHCRPNVRTPCCGSFDCHQIAGVTVLTCPWCSPQTATEKEYQSSTKTKKEESMAVAKDWVMEAAKELASWFSFGSGRDSYVTPEQRQNVMNNYASIIARYCPFKPDVAYMPVPRCETCAHWHGPQRHADGREQCTEPTISPDQMDEFMTLPDFGCVRWKAKS